MADNVSTARRLYKLWNDRDFDELANMATEESQIEIVGTGDVFQGPEGSRQYSSVWSGGFPDGHITVDNLVAAGDCVVVEFTGTGTHTGTFITSAGEIPATGRSVTVKFCDVLEFRDANVIRQRTYFDSGSMMAQLGLTAPQQQATTT